MIVNITAGVLERKSKETGQETQLFDEHNSK
jgi:hypothetical protein